MQLKGMFANLVLSAAASTTISRDTDNTDMYNVAIIGAGAAGSTTAYFLSQYAAEASVPVNITVYEREPYIGGRCTTVSAYNDSRLPIELGASIFVKVNHILVEATQHFNLSTSAYSSSRIASPEIPSLGIWDGEQFVVKLASSGPTWWDAGKLLLKYGLSPIRTMQLMKSTVGQFLKMYEEPVFPFYSLTHAAAEVDLLGVTTSTGVQYLSEHHISAKYAHDVIQASTRVNYAQNLHNFHGLETMVCMATDGAMAIEDGNWHIFEHMIAAADASTLLNTSVNQITRTAADGYQLRVASDSRPLGRTFDAVVLAAPYQYSGVELPEDAIIPSKIEYVKLHVTLFTSPHLLSPMHFGLRKDELVPRTVLTTTKCPGGTPACFCDDDHSPDFFSISLLHRLTNPTSGRQEYAYKIFSQEEPTQDWLLAILDDDGTSESITWLYRKVWHSYPKEVPIASFTDIVLEEDLYYTGGMDSFISTMETNALMGKNVAKLIINKWTRPQPEPTRDKIDL